MSVDPDKLAALILMLSSEHDGEVVNAARALNRLLGRAKVDWHWLAARVTGAAEPVDVRRLQHEAYERGFDQGRKSVHPAQPPPRQQGFNAHQLAARWIVANYRAQLNPKTLGFLEDMQIWTGRPTEKQAIWLNDLCQRFGYRP